jgi:hypothetical protein
MTPHYVESETISGDAVVGLPMGIWTLKGSFAPDNTVPKTTIQMCKESFKFSSISLDTLGRLRYSIVS